MIPKHFQAENAPGFRKSYLIPDASRSTPLIRDESILPLKCPPSAGRGGTEAAPPLLRSSRSSLAAQGPGGGVKPAGRAHVSGPQIFSKAKRTRNKTCQSPPQFPPCSLPDGFLSEAVEKPVLGFRYMHIRSLSCFNPQSPHPPTD